MGFEPFSIAPALGYIGLWVVCSIVVVPFRPGRFLRSVTKGYPDFNRNQKQPTPPINRLFLHSNNQIEYLSRSRSKYEAGNTEILIGLSLLDGKLFERHPTYISDNTILTMLQVYMVRVYTSNSFRTSLDRVCSLRSVLTTWWPTSSVGGSMLDQSAHNTQRREQDNKQRSS